MTFNIPTAGTKGFKNGTELLRVYSTKGTYPYYVIGSGGVFKNTNLVTGVRKVNLYLND